MSKRPAHANKVLRCSAGVTLTINASTDFVAGDTCLKRT
jgi:hypothetical protein